MERLPRRTESPYRFVSPWSTIEPAIWRQLVSPGASIWASCTGSIQAAFGWWNYHLHQFRIGSLRYGDPQTEVGGPEPRRARVSFDETEVRLLDFGRVPDRSFPTSTTSVTTGTTQSPSNASSPSTSHRAPHLHRRRPSPSTRRRRRRARLPALPRRHGRSRPFRARDTSRWCDGHFDPAWFDLTLTNKDVKNALRLNVRRRLHQPKPKRAKRPT